MVLIGSYSSFFFISYPIPVGKIAKNQSVGVYQYGTVFWVLN